MIVNPNRKGVSGTKRRTLILSVLVLLVASTVCVAAVHQYHSHVSYFDSNTNGLWVGRQWFTGVNVRTGLPVPLHDIEEFSTLIKKSGIRYVFVRTGTLLPSGAIPQLPSQLYYELQRLNPDSMYLPWLSGDRRQLPLSSDAWRKEFIGELRKLTDRGILGIHLNIEPVSSDDTGYLDLLRDIRLTFGKSFFLSHATRPAGPYGVSLWGMKRHLWSRDFYKSTMRYANQSVVMAYNTRLRFELPYRAFVAHQTGLLLDWSCSVTGHRVLIGIPSYEHAPSYSDPRTENIRTASLGVRSALSRKKKVQCFDGVSIYSNWTTDPSDWSDYRNYWVGKDKTTLNDFGFQPVSVWDPITGQGPVVRSTGIWD